VSDLDINAGLFGPIGGVQVGDEFTGRFSYEIAPTNPDQAPGDPELGIYNGSELVIEGAAIPFEPPLVSVRHAFIATLPPAPPSSFDRFTIATSSPGSLYLAGIRLTLEAPYGAAFSDDSLPETLDLSAFTDGAALAGVRAIGIFPVPNIEDRGTIASLLQVPEPTASAMIAAGLFMVRRWSRKAPL
jgi:hypothetical protein